MPRLHGIANKIRNGPLVIQLLVVIGLILILILLGWFIKVGLTSLKNLNNSNSNEKFANVTNLQLCGGGVYDDVAKTCTCPANTTLKQVTDTNGNIRYNCACPVSFIWSNTTNSCVCPNGATLNNEQCICDNTNKLPDNGTCPVLVKDTPL